MQRMGIAASRIGLAAAVDIDAEDTRLRAAYLIEDLPDLRLQFAVIAKPVYRIDNDVCLLKGFVEICSGPDQLPVQKGRGLYGFLGCRLPVDRYQETLPVFQFPACDIGIAAVVSLSGKEKDHIRRCCFLPDLFCDRPAGQLHQLVR